MDEYIAIAKEKHGYNMEQVINSWKMFKCVLSPSPAGAEVGFLKTWFIIFGKYKIWCKREAEITIATFNMLILALGDFY